MLKAKSGGQCTLFLISQILKSLTHCATFECETYAVLKAFEAADLYAEENGGQTFSRKVSIHLDNLEAKLTLETALAERTGSSCLEALLVNNSRVRNMLHEIKQYMTRYESVSLVWVRAHTGARNVTSIANDEADRLAKQGLLKALDLVEIPDSEINK